MSFTQAFVGCVACLLVIGFLYVDNQERVFHETELKKRREKHRNRVLNDE